MKETLSPFSHSLETISYRDVEEDVITPEADFNHESSEYNELRSFVQNTAREYQQALQESALSEKGSKPHQNDLEATDWMRPIASSFKKNIPTTDQFSDSSPEAQRAADSYVRSIYKLPELARSLLIVEKGLARMGEVEHKEPLDKYMVAHYFKVCSWLKETMPILIHTNSNPQLLGVGINIIQDQLVKTASILYPDPSEIIKRPADMRGTIQDRRGLTISQIAETHLNGALGATHFVKALEEDGNFQEQFADFDLCYAPASMDAFAKTDFLLMPKDRSNRMYALQLKTAVSPRNDLSQIIWMGETDSMQKQLSGLVKVLIERGGFKDAEHYADIAAGIPPFERALKRGIEYLQSDENGDYSWKEIDMKPILCYSSRDSRLNQAGNVPQHSQISFFKGDENE